MKDLQEARIVDQLTEMRPKLKQLLPVLILLSILELISSSPNLYKLLLEHFSKQSDSSLQVRPSERLL